MLLSVILASGTLMLLPYMIGWLVDEVISSQNMSRFIYIVGLGCQKPILIFDFACTLKI